METENAPWWRILRTAKERFLLVLGLLLFGWIPVGVASVIVAGIIELAGGHVHVAAGASSFFVWGAGLLLMLVGVCAGYVSGYRRRVEEGPLPEHEPAPRWIGPISGRTYYRPAIYSGDLKLTKREYEEMTPGQISGDEYFPLNRRQKLRMRWLNRPGSPEWGWDGDDKCQSGQVRRRPL
jgi:hypothetical protein